MKANREAATLRFAAGNEDVPRSSTTAALTAKFAPTRCAPGKDHENPKMYVMKYAPTLVRLLDKPKTLCACGRVTIMCAAPAPPPR